MRLWGQVDTSKPKYYVLDMFPYPSGAGLHVGHPEGYTATDILARYKRMRGCNVLHPMGWDAFGLPAEQYALDTGTHPRETTRANVDRFRAQLKALGFSYDWERELSTTDPDYFKWTQWIFLRLLEKGLAYQAEVPVNWCPALGTVLANEEVIDGLSERGGHPVERRPMRQWMLRITAYADRLLEDLDELDWDESIKEMQRNWIGRSEGAEIDFQVEGLAGQALRAFTTRADTLFGVTYVVVAPEHPLAESLAELGGNLEAVQAYVKEAAGKSELERTELQKAKTGVHTGAFAVNPANGERVPVLVADYVLGSYGSGAVMAVPGHDSRDREFAAAFDLPVRVVVAPGGKGGGGEKGEAGEAETFTEPGVVFASSCDDTGLSIDGLETADAKARVAGWLEERGLGGHKVNYKLRDWLFARQRYWGEPFPVVFPEGSTEPVPVPEADLPVLLPEVESYAPSGDGNSPLAQVEDWVRTTVPGSSRPGTRETNTMPQWAGSCWYYLRFIDPTNTKALVDPEKEKYWMPVDLYIGGAEHAVLHLLYARFWHKVLFDLGVVSTKEPFRRLVSQGMILGEVEYTAFRGPDGAWVSVEAAEGCEPVRVAEDAVEKAGNHFVLKADRGVRVAAKSHKMSKSRGNVVNPDDIVEQYGADSLRLYEMFMGPLRDKKTWNTRSIEGVHRFLAKAHRLSREKPLSEGAGSEAQRKAAARLSKKVTDDTEGLRFNTAISAMMEFVNEAGKWDTVPREAMETFAKVLSPYAPHLAEELWGTTLGHPESLTYEPWPEADESLLVESSVTLPVQVNGKMRGAVELPAGAAEAEALEAGRALPAVQKFLEGKQVAKVIFVPGRILNLVAK